MVGGFITTCTYAIGAYHHYCCEFESCSWRGVLDSTLCDKICQWLATGLWFSLGTPVSSTNKTDRHDIAETLLKLALNTKKHCNPNPMFCKPLQFTFTIFSCYLYFFGGKNVHRIVIYLVTMTTYYQNSVSKQLYFELNSGSSYKRKADLPKWI